MYTLYYKTNEIEGKTEYADFNVCVESFFEHIRAGFRTRVFDDKGNLILGREEIWK